MKSRSTIIILHVLIQDICGKTTSFIGQDLIYTVPFMKFLRLYQVKSNSGQENGLTVMYCSEDWWQEWFREGGVEENPDLGLAGPGLLMSQSRLAAALTCPDALTVQCQPVLIVTAMDRNS